MKNSWQHMDLDKHLAVSVVAGLIDNYVGASNYLNERPNPSQANQTLICRAKTKEERLDLQFLLCQEPPCIPRDGPGKRQGIKATHVVVGVDYGAEAYCVLTENLDGIGEYARARAERKLWEMTTKMKNGLEDGQDITEFQEKFDQDEKQRLNCLLNCRLYADFQSQSVRECDVFDAYKNCLKLVENTRKTGAAVPIAVLLCPLEDAIDLEDTFEREFEYAELEDQIADNLCLSWTILEDIVARADALMDSFQILSLCPLREFKHAILNFQHLMRESLKDGVVKARDDERYDCGDVAARVAGIVEIHTLFRPSRLERWLEYKETEMEMVSKMVNLNGINFVSSQDQLEREMAESFDKKFTLVLNVPPMDDKSNRILESMTYYFERNSTLEADTKIKYDSDTYDIYDDYDEEYRLKMEEKIPWHMIQQKRKQFLDKIRELVRHVERNKELKNHVMFSITISNKFGGRYSVYEDGELLKGNLIKLPVPPIGLRIHPGTPGSAESSTFLLKWDYPALGYSHHFLVEYRKEGSESWRQLRTTKSGRTQMAVSFPVGTSMEFRVAADTCIGRSEFSAVIDTETVPDAANDTPEAKKKTAVAGDLGEEAKTNSSRPKPEKKRRPATKASI